MVITLGILLQVGQPPAVAVPPAQPYIEATIVSPTSRSVTSISSVSHSSPQSSFQSYNPRGEQTNLSLQTGMRLDIFA